MWGKRRELLTESASLAPKPGFYHLNTYNMISATSHKDWHHDTLHWLIKNVTNMGSTEDLEKFRER